MINKLNDKIKDLQDKLDAALQEADKLRKLNEQLKAKL